MSGVKVALWLAIITLSLCILVAVSGEVHGQGSFDQPLVVEGVKPVRRVVYWDGPTDVTKRQEIEQSVDRSWLDGELAERRGERYVARLVFGVQSGVLRGTRVTHYPHLVVAVEFEDGTFVVRVADIPPDMGKTPIVIRCD